MIGVEVLDDPGADPALVRAELTDLTRLNRWFGGARAVVRTLMPLLPPAGGSCTLLDVGTGSGDIPRAIARAAQRRRVTVRTLGLDRSPVAARVASTTGLATAVSDGGSLPLAPRSVDFVVLSQVLHHLEPAAATRWIRELDRVARRAVIIADLRRSRVAMLAMWLVSFPLGLHPVTRRDAVVSLRRGYTVGELEALLSAAGVTAMITSHPIARLVAVWEPC
ncbi:MAG TPA: methyltransferase domain-containing protein [Gemmatimonadales bacterium]|jgi:SAM-dependent methyltransferase|nr:methyltransferase domain-containing protein [Gemmatimonadales bacterium]